jgi:hypothetical protein
MDIELTEVEVKLIVQALKIWHGDFPSSNCTASIIWEKELKQLIEKLEPYLG